MDYPPTCIKGVPNVTFLNDEGCVGMQLFLFDGSGDRGDGWLESSVNWRDDEEAVAVTLRQRKADGQIQFRIGAALLPRDEIEQLRRRPLLVGLLEYERRPLDDNPYHGNILVRAGTSKPTRNLIASGLALAVTEIIPQAADA